MSGSVVKDRFLAQERLARAVSRAQTELLFQPRFALAEQRLVAFEAIPQRPRSVRARAPRESVSREASRDGPLLRQACRLAAGASHTETWLLSLPITAAQAACGLLGQLVGELLGEGGLPPERLELQFGEDVLESEDPDLPLLLAGLRDLGVGVAWGGFGGHASSLTLLRRLSLAGLLGTLKLHPLLVSDLDGVSWPFLHGVIDAAHALGLAVVADGVESAAHHRCLQEAGCDQGMGDVLGAAQPACEALRALRVDARARGPARW